MDFFIVQCFIIVLTVVADCKGDNANSVVTGTYKAAVYEHDVILPPNPRIPVSREIALENMMKNLEIYRDQTEKAAAERVDITVFPEDGIYGMSMSRLSLASYLEYIPDPKLETWCPCMEPERYPNSEVQIFLSCLAKNSSMYVVVNFGDRQPCNKASDPQCPIFGHYQYNTDLVYDRTGTLIAKYHKENLFYEFQFDKPRSTEFVYFDTPFGRFGLFTCFDILFHDPAIKLIKTFNVTDVAFPTAWMDALPLLAAIQFHSAFAAGVGVNLLSANIHRPQNRYQGSGLYSPDGAAAYYYDDKTKGGKLLISELKVIKNANQEIRKQERLSHSEVCQSVVKSERRKRFFLAEKQAQQFHSYVFHDLFTFVALSSNETKLTICQHSVCCHLEYEFAEKNGSEYFAFGAFDGLHTYQGKYYLQICTLLKCASDKPKSCGSITKQSTTKFRMKKFKAVSALRMFSQKFY